MGWICIKTIITFSLRLNPINPITPDLCTVPCSFLCILLHTDGFTCAQPPRNAYRSHLNSPFLEIAGKCVFPTNTIHVDTVIILTDIMAI